jgi:dTDP-4-dehydrorhamnose reductase
MTVRVFVLGHRGMLGHVVARFLAEQGCSVHTSDERYDGQPESSLVRAIQRSGCDVVVNCARAGDEKPADLLTVNALLPLHVAAMLKPGSTLVQASSDAVFSPRPGARPVSDGPDATDPYGLSKRLAEGCSHFARTVILRTSIVGPEVGPSRSLLGRALATDVPYRGYVDHWWNGITTLEWARLAHRAALGTLPAGIHQPACDEPVTKYELVSAIRRIYGRPVQVEPAESGRPVDRTLEPTIRVGAIETQLRELRTWYEGATAPR